MATLGRHFFYHEDNIINEVANWDDKETIENYMDPEYSNIERDTMLGRQFQAFENDNYVPPVTDNSAHHFVELRNLVSELVDQQKQVLAEQKLLVNASRVMVKSVFAVLRIMMTRV